MKKKMGKILSDYVYKKVCIIYLLIASQKIERALIVN